MHNDDIEQEHNLWDNEHPEDFIYDAELLNAWYWNEWEITRVISPENKE